MTYTLMTYTLRPYQREAVEATLAHFRKSRAPAVIVLPTGAGKSLVIAELARVARGRALVLAHVKELLEQNYEKYTSYGLQAGLYSAGLERKDSQAKVIFGGVQSVARAPKEFFHDFSLLIVDECHRVSLEEDSQYAQVIRALYRDNPQLCVLGLTATPYRLDAGWIYRYHYRGELRSQKQLFFQKCIFELPLEYMVEKGFLVPPVQIDTPVASYDFSSLEADSMARRFSTAEIEAILKDQSRVTPAIVKNIIELAKERRAVMIFTASVRHAHEIQKMLPAGRSAVILGDTPSDEREAVIARFKQGEIKFLVNVSVLTTGFDAPNVDVIAILRPTESVSLYQQIVGRGLRLSEGKQDCLVLDYTGVAHDIFEPEIAERKPHSDAVPVRVPCPECEHINDFWGLLDENSGAVVEHFGEECRGAKQNPEDGSIVPCGFRYRYQLCDSCGTENSRTHSNCSKCGAALKDDSVKLKEARAAKDCHVMRPDSWQFLKRTEKSGREALEIRYYDHDGQYLSERFYFDTEEARKVFFYNFERMHSKLPECRLGIHTVDDALHSHTAFRTPLFVIARKQEKYWRVREKIFVR